ncbi:MAG: hypothetical protein P4M13_08410 [Alphaproteobacteria bacterium]|nr:hypothetical protein [Alphaproteobacteria bacterium]
MLGLGSRIGSHNGLKTLHSLVNASTRSYAPVKKPACVMHPENAPRTIPDGGFPEDFDLYEYGGATIETVDCIGENGETVRRPAMVARMIKKYQNEDGVSIEEEMTASIADLIAFSGQLEMEAAVARRA